MGRLTNKVGLVTGAARGIGEAIARRFVREGASVILSDIHDAGGIGVADQIGEAASYARLDVREEADWRRVIDGILDTYGRLDILVNISSRSGLVGIPAAAAYASSKAAVRNHTKSVALYCAAEGLAIRCNSVHPAAILTPMWDAMLGAGEDRERRMAEFVRDTPLRRFGTVEEVAQAVIYLASDESRYTTGIELVLDGGLLAGSAATPKQ